MKPGRSGAVTGCLPSDFAKAKARSQVASVVDSPRITSTSAMRGTGLKKCSPMNLSGRVVAAASSVMHTEDVFEQSSVSGPTTDSTAANAARLASTFSTIASTTRSLSARASKRVVPLSRPIAASRASRVVLPRATPLSRKRSIRPSPASTAA